MRKVRNLQKLILNSQAARLLAIRQVTQLNTGKKTPGIDGKASLNFEERFRLNELLKQHSNDWKHQKLREIPIPKKDGTSRMLKVPTIADRAWQCLAKSTVEPAHEAQFHARSYGFRPGRSAHDAQKVLFNNLNAQGNGIQKRVLELDIEKCFDRISHTAILEPLIAPQCLKQGLFRCLKVGTNVGFPDQGTPQGGVVSPLLANIALNGIENIHHSVRYADDMVFILKPEDNATEILNEVQVFLSLRGMNISEHKTKLTASTDGFDFLGWRFLVQHNGKFKSTPSVENFNALRKKVKAIVNNANYGANAKARKLSPLVRGWRNYHRYCYMNGGRHTLNFIQKRAYQVFNREPKQNRHTCRILRQQAFPKVSWSANRHINVKGSRSPYDGDLVYWSRRNSKLYTGLTATTLAKQNHTCAVCSHKLLDNEPVHLHHVDGNHANWKPNNLQALHESCHDYLTWARC
jgi:group II intron reverse transcriptase/maturase